MESKGLSEESVTNLASSGYSFAPKRTYIHISKIAVKFKGNRLKQDKVYFTHRNVVNFFIFYGLDTRFRDLNTNSTFKKLLFEAVKLTKNDDGIGFDLRSIVF